MTEVPADEALVQFLYRAPIGLIQTTSEGTITLINPMAAQLLMPLAISGTMVNLFEVLKAVAPGLRDLASARNLPGDLVCEALPLSLPHHASVHGGPQVLGLHMTRIDDSTLMACLSDMTVAAQREHQRLEETLHGQKRIDALTSLPNRTAVLERIQRTLARRQDEPGYQFGVVLVNADRFERINVTLGHASGDEVLRLMGSRMASAARAMGEVSSSGESAAMAARLGADEFVLCFDAPTSHALDAPVVTDRLLGALNNPFSIGDQTVHLLSSAGLVTASNVFDDAESVLEHASLAMREAKRAGGARHVLYEPAMMDRAKQRGDLESELRIALAEGQLFTVYQPIVDLTDGSVAGMEALVRWRHPERGTIMPAEFIAVAEATGLIRELGEWVLIETCRQLVSWQILLGDRSPRTVSVNLSRAQLADPGIVGRVASALGATRLPPVCLQLEVTESLAAQDAEVQGRLKELKQLGLTLALDDFGTGYSSLASLHDLPIDVVKIDRSFVCPVETSAHHRVLIESVVRVARSLGMSTVAEGIETACEAALLGALGCSKGQGYFYSTPLPAEEATAWLVAYRSPSVVLR